MLTYAVSLFILGEDGVLNHTAYIIRGETREECILKAEQGYDEAVAYYEKARPSPTYLSLVMTSYEPDSEPDVVPDSYRIELPLSFQVSSRLSLGLENIFKEVKVWNETKYQQALTV